MRELATDRSQSCVELVEIFTDPKHVSSMKIEIKPGNIVTATIESIVFTDQLAEFVSRLKSYKLTEKEPS